jgi:RNA methyltransferase, TrmH family
MISKNKAKMIRSLHLRKFRDELGLFVAEGTKLSLELLASGFQIKMLVATKEWLSTNANALFNPTFEIMEGTQEEIDGMSSFSSPQQVLVVVEVPQYECIYEDLHGDLVLALDTIQDPGNLGTILRIADWFGIHHVMCSLDTVDVFNPKVVQASMGALCRVKAYYQPLDEWILSYTENYNMPVYGTFIEGKDIYSADLNNNGVIVMGNESKGISERISKRVTQRISVPSFPGEGKTSESLNVSVATGIICSEFRRRIR